MIKSILSFAIITAVFISCKDDSQPNNYEEQLKDSIFKTYSYVASVTIKVNPDHDKLEVILGAPALHDKSENDRQKVGDEIALMALHIFDKDYNFNDASLMVSTDKTSEFPAASTIVTTKINIDSLKKLTEKK
jgi:hypothetical protein